ncbi:MAG: phage tail tape measure protein, partial [Ruminococcus sp.]|nr:phage tail tape measure protein [Ruminococcus sp.]
GNLVTQGINLAIEKVKEFTTEIIETGKAFEASMSNVGAISGATGDELENLSEKAKQMGATTKYTASQAADAFGYMALAGWETEDMLAGIDGVLSLAAASNMDLAKASDIVTDYLTAFGLTAQDSSKFVDQMSYAMSKSNTTTELLGEAYKNCAATAASMGYSVEETTAVLMTMANAGVKGGEAGTALNAIMTRLATDTNGCAAQLSKFGINIYDTQGNMQSLSSILQGVSGVWATLTDQQQANLAKTIAGTNHYSALQTIMNGLSDSAKESGMSFTDYASALEECDGTAQNMADTMIDNLAGDMTILDSSIDGVKIALSDKLNPIIRDLVQYITEKMPEIQESSEKAIDTVVLIAEWCRKHMPEIKETAKDLIPYIVGIGSGFAGWNVATKVTSVINKLFGVVKSGSVYMKLLNAVMSANPAVAVTTAIVGLTGAFVAWKKVQEDEVSIADKVNEKYKEQTERIQNIKDTINDSKQAFCDSATAIDDETQKTKDLWKELHNLAGESGVVLDADRKRAEYILGELNEALGTEYSMTGNQIENYQTLADEIDKVIEKKHAEALLDAALAQSAEMAEQKRKAKNDYLEQSKLLREAETAKNKAFVEFSKSISGTGNSGMTAEEIKDNYGKEGQLFVIDEEQYNATVAYLDAKGEVETIKDNLGKAEDSYYQAVEYENNIRKAQEEIYKGNYDIEKVIYPNEKLLVDKNAPKDEKL